MQVIHMLPFRKGFFEVPNKTCFVFALTHQKPKAFKYGYLSKVKKHRELAEIKQGNLISQQKDLQKFN